MSDTIVMDKDKVESNSNPCTETIYVSDIDVGKIVIISAFRQRKRRSAVGYLDHRRGD